MCGAVTDLLLRVRRYVYFIKIGYHDYRRTHQPPEKLRTAETSHVLVVQALTGAQADLRFPHAIVETRRTGGLEQIWEPKSWFKPQETATYWF